MDSLPNLDTRTDAAKEIEAGRMQMQQQAREEARREALRLREERMKELESANGVDLLASPVETLSENQFGELLLAAHRRNREGHQPTQRLDAEILKEFAVSLGNLQIPELQNKELQSRLDTATDEFFFAVRTIIARP